MGMVSRQRWPSMGRKYGKVSLICSRCGYASTACSDGGCIDSKYSWGTLAEGMNHAEELPETPRQEMLVLAGIAYGEVKSRKMHGSVRRAFSNDPQVFVLSHHMRFTDVIISARKDEPLSHRVGYLCSDSNITIYAQVLTPIPPRVRFFALINGEKHYMSWPRVTFIEGCDPTLWFPHKSHDQEGVSDSPGQGILCWLHWLAKCNQYHETKRRMVQGENSGPQKGQEFELVFRAQGHEIAYAESD